MKKKFNNGGNNMLNTKFRNWAIDKAWPWLKKTALKVWSVVKKILSKLRISWVGILALVILVKMAQNGDLNDMPNLKWFIESGIRLTEWAFGLIRHMLEWIVELPDFGVFEFIEKWLRTMFAI